MFCSDHNDGPDRYIHTTVLADSTLVSDRSGHRVVAGVGRLENLPRWYADVRKEGEYA